MAVLLNQKLATTKPPCKLVDSRKPTYWCIDTNASTREFVFFSIFHAITYMMHFFPTLDQWKPRKHKCCLWLWGLMEYSQKTA